MAALFEGEEDVALPDEQAEEGEDEGDDLVFLE